MKKKYEIKKIFNIKNIILLFLVIQPFFDLIYVYGNMSTLIRVMITFFLFFCTIVKYKDKNALILFLIYYLGVGIYFLLHHFHCVNFNSLVPDNFNYNLFKEALYFLKMSTPFALIYVAYKNIFSEENISKAYKIVILIMSGSIVITNFLGVSLTTYKDGLIKANFISWFFDAYDKYTYMDLASRGLFYFANHIIAILIMLVPIMTYILIKKFNYKNIITHIILILAMILLGNKISVFGTYITIICILITYLFFTKIIKNLIFNKKTLIYLFILIITYSFLIFYSPAYMRLLAERQGRIKPPITDNSNEDGGNIIYEPKSTEEMIEYIEENYIGRGIPWHFINQSYPYKYDPEFWFNLLQEPNYNGINYRYFEIKMIERVIDINNNKKDFWFGIGYSRHMNIFNVERDYINQYYSLGLIGTMIFIGPYIGLAFLIIALLFKKGNFNIGNTMFVLSIILILIAAFFGGNLFNSLSVMIPFAYILGFTLCFFDKSIKCMLKYTKETRWSMLEKVNKYIKKIKRDGFFSATKKAFTRVHIDYLSYIDVAQIIKFKKRKNELEYKLKKLLNEKKYNRIIIWRSSIGWNIPLFQRPQHLANTLSDEKCLIFYEVTRNTDKINFLEKRKENLYLIDYESKHFAKLFRDVCKKVKKPKYIFIASTCWDLSDKLIDDYVKEGYKVLYDYLDHLSPELAGTDKLPQNVNSIHNYVISNVNNAFVLATADILYRDMQKKRKSEKNLLYVSNGVDYDHFTKLKRKATLSKDFVTMLKDEKPIIGYYGALASWFDYDLIKYLADNRPNYNIALIGSKYDSSFDNQNFSKFKNVYYFGPKKFDELPYYAKHFDICILPFLINDITQATNPIKIFEYMALSKPIISTDLYECRKYKSIKIAKNQKEFVNLCDSMIKMNDSSYFSQLKKEALNNTWVGKAKDIVKALTNFEKNR